MSDKDAPTQETAKRLMEARVAAGYATAKEFADKNNIPQPTYSLHESGKRGLKRRNVSDCSSSQCGEVADRQCARA